MGSVAKFAASIGKTDLLLRWSHFCAYIQHMSTKFSSASGTAWQKVPGFTLEIFTLCITDHNTAVRESIWKDKHLTTSFELMPCYWLLDSTPTQSHRNLDPRSPGLPSPGCAAGAFSASVSTSQSMMGELSGFPAILYAALSKVITAYCLWGWGFFLGSCIVVTFNYF